MDNRMKISKWQVREADTRVSKKSVLLKEFNSKEDALVYWKAVAWQHVDHVYMQHTVVPVE